MATGECDQSHKSHLDRVDRYQCRDTDPDFVNDVSEKDQRWGNQKTLANVDKIDLDTNMQGS
ncbi:hypothetical protein BC830DRAFT_1154714 [Chytriomyces sp. MP71]|nr:hypothetical protein BC830DRAFT_1154714 [Chytriomyces sp. MP71]